MAAEYSRELSAKVFAGQCRQAQLGYRQGARAGFGLRRAILGPRGEIKMVLGHGEQKYLQTDRVTLVPGPAQEVKVVQQIYRWLLNGLTPAEIATRLRARHLRTDLGRTWSERAVYWILTNEKYAGTYVYNLRSRKLGMESVTNPPEARVRKEGAFEALVPMEHFAAAQAILHRQHFSDAELLEHLRLVYDEHGFVTIPLMRKHGLPDHRRYLERFGSMIRAYELIGYVPKRDFRFLEAKPALRQTREGVVQTIAGSMRRVGSAVVRDSGTDVLRIDGQVSLAVVLARARRSRYTGAMRWHVRADRCVGSGTPDIWVVARLDDANVRVRDYYFLPPLVAGTAPLVIGPRNATELEDFRHDRLECLYKLLAPQHS